MGKWDIESSYGIPWLFARDVPPGWDFRKGYRTNGNVAMDRTA